MSELLLTHFQDGDVQYNSPHAIPELRPVARDQLAHGGHPEENGYHGHENAWASKEGHRYSYGLPIKTA
jgi:hypothetical protein